MLNIWQFCCKYANLIRVSTFALCLFEYVAMPVWICRYACLNMSLCLFEYVVMPVWICRYACLNMSLCLFIYVAMPVWICRYACLNMSLCLFEYVAMPYTYNTSYLYSDLTPLWRRHVAVIKLIYYSYRLIYSLYADLVQSSNVVYQLNSVETTET